MFVLAVGCRHSPAMVLDTHARSAVYVGEIGSLDVSVNGVPAPLTQPIRCRNGECIAISGALSAANGLRFSDDQLIAYENGRGRYVDRSEDAEVENELDAEEGSFLIIRSVYYLMDSEGKSGPFFDEYVYRELFDGGTKAKFHIAHQVVPETKGRYELRLEISTPRSLQKRNGIVDYGSSIVNKLCDVIVE